MKNAPRWLGNVRRARRRGASLVLAAIVLGACVDARAETNASPDAGFEGQAGEVHVRRGRALVAEGRHDQAYRELEEGHRLTARAPLLFEMGECARAGGAVERARQAYARYLVEDPDGDLAPVARLRLGELSGAPAPAADAPPPAPPPLAIQRPSASVAVAASPVVTAPAASAPPPPPRASRRWPLWIAIGAAALAIAGGTLYAVYATSRDGEACGAGCYDLR